MRGLKLADTAFLGQHGITGPVLPTDLASLVRWYKADSFSLADGTAIGGVGNTWIDQSVSAAHLTQATAGNRPVFHTNIFGAKPAISFTSASSHFLTMPLLTLAVGSLFTIVVVGTSTNDNIILGTDSAGAGNCQVRFRHASAANLVFFFAGVGVDSAAFATAQSSVRASTWKRVDNAGSMNYRDGTTDKTAGGNDNGQVDINMVSGPFGLYTNGNIAEICIWSTAHTDGNMDALYTNYFKPRWGLP